MRNSTWPCQRTSIEMGSTGQGKDKGRGPDAASTKSEVGDAHADAATTATATQNGDTGSRVHFEAPSQEAAGGAEGASPSRRGEPEYWHDAQETAGPAAGSANGSDSSTGSEKKTVGLSEVDPAVLRQSLDEQVPFNLQRERYGLPQAPNGQREHCRRDRHCRNNCRS